MSNYILGESWVRSSVQREGEELSGLGAFDTGVAAVDSLIARANADLSRLIQPSWGAIDASALPADEKDLLKNQPVTFLLQAVDRFEGLAAEIITEATNMSGKQIRTIGIPGVNQTTVSMLPDQPGDRTIPSLTGRHLVRMLRIGMQWMVFSYQAPIYLAAAVAKVFAKYGIIGGEMLKAFILTAGNQAAAQAQRVVAAGAAEVARVTGMAQQAGQNAAQALQNAAGSILDNVSRLVPALPPPPPPPHLFGLGGFGAAPAAPAAAPPAAGGLTLGGVLTAILTTPGIAALIASVVVALITTGGQVITSGGGNSVVSGTQRPGPDGSTDGNWINGQWVPNAAKSGLPDWALPAGAAAVLALLLLSIKK